MEQVIIPRETRGKYRKQNPAYNKITRQISKAKKKGDKELVKELTQKRRQLRVGDQIGDISLAWGTSDMPMIFWLAYTATNIWHKT